MAEMEVEDEFEKAGIVFNRRSGLGIDIKFFRRFETSARITKKIIHVISCIEM